MSRRPRRNHSAAFKAKVALAAIKGEKTLTELAEQFDVDANQITQWKSQLLEDAPGVFGDAKAAPADELVDVKTMHAKIGALALRQESQAALAGIRDKAEPTKTPGPLVTKGARRVVDLRFFQARAPGANPGGWG